MTQRLLAGITGILAMSIGTTACSRGTVLAERPLEITGQPTEVRFLHSCAQHGPEWAICFEFNPPGDSHHAAAIKTVLIAESGERVPLNNPAIDRAGEATVCQIAALTTVPVHARQAAYRGVELSSDPPVRLRAIRGGTCL